MRDGPGIYGGTLGRARWRQKLSTFSKEYKEYKDNNQTSK
jgi:hypothetical protein